MPIDASVLITTVSGATSNSYVTLPEFIAYCDLRLNTGAVQAADPDDKIRALLEAARKLNRIRYWKGYPTDKEQALVWPRTRVVKLPSPSYQSSGYYYSGYWYSNTEEWPGDAIPQPVKDAQCELAIAFLEGYTGDSQEPVAGSFTVDGLSVDISQPQASGGLPARVKELIADLLDMNTRRRA